MSFYRNQLDLMIGYVAAVVHHAGVATEGMEKENELSAEQFFSIFTEYIFFFVHLVDRRISQLMEEKKRAMLMKQILDLSVREAIDAKGFFLDEETKQELYNKCVRDYGTAISEYGKLPEYTKEKDEAGHMPLYWEFSERVASIWKQQPNTGTIIGILDLLLLQVKDLNIKFFSEELVSDRWERE